VTDKATFHASAVLICDDEPEVRAAMRRTLRGHVIVEADCARSAIQEMKVHAFDAIVTDFSMDDTGDGLELLQFVKLQYPDMVRVLVTGTRTLEVALRAVNEGAVHRYFLKPWNDHAFRSALEIVLHSRNSRMA
jgi:DNA-binding NtrC family response regulator